MAKAVEAGSMCHCGHDMYSHYMCGAPYEMRCYGRAQCGCEQYVDRQFVPATQVDEVRRRAAEMRGDNKSTLRRHGARKSVRKTEGR